MNPKLCEMNIDYSIKLRKKWYALEKIANMSRHLFSSRCFQGLRILCATIIFWRALRHSLWNLRSWRTSMYFFLGDNEINIYRRVTKHKRARKRERMAKWTTTKLILLLLQFCTRYICTYRLLNALKLMCARSDVNILRKCQKFSDQKEKFYSFRSSIFDILVTRENVIKK